MTARFPVLRLAGRAAVPHEFASRAGLERDPRAVAGGSAVGALIADGDRRDRILLGRADRTHRKRLRTRDIKQLDAFSLVSSLLTGMITSRLAGLV